MNCAAVDLNLLCCKKINEDFNGTTRDFGSDSRVQSDETQLKMLR